MSDSKISAKDLPAIAAEVVRRADAQGENGWFDLPVPVEVRPEGTLRVPRAPFEHWAVRRSLGSHLALPWKAVSPVGVKQGDDDPFHTDWMLGAGLSPRDMHPSGDNLHREALSSAAYEGMSEVQARLLGFDSTVLLSGPSVLGRVVRPVSPRHLGDLRYDGDLPPVLVMRDASPEWLEAAFRALAEGGAVIVERGGAMAHLVTELRGASAGPMMRVPNALTAFPEGAAVQVSPDLGKVSLAEYYMPPTSVVSFPPVEDPQPIKSVSSGNIGAHANGGNRIRDADVPLPRMHILQKGERGPADDMEYMSSFGYCDGRDFRVRVSSHYSRVHHGNTDEKFGYLEAYIHPNNSNDRAKRLTVVAESSVQLVPGIGNRFAKAALALAYPVEAYDSSESVALRKKWDDDAAARFAGRVAHMDNAALVAGLQTATRDYLEAGDRIAAKEHDEGDVDARNAFRHEQQNCKVEFERRGMTVTVWDVECAAMEEHEVDKAQAIHETTEAEMTRPATFR